MNRKGAKLLHEGLRSLDVVLSAHFRPTQSGSQTFPPSARRRRSPARATRKTCRSRRAPASLSSPPLRTHKHKQNPKVTGPSTQIEIAPKINKKKGGGRGTKVICADLQCLRLTHDEADLGGLLVLQQLDGARTPLLPLVPLLIESIQLGLTAEPHPRVRSKHSKIGSDRTEAKSERQIGSG